MADFTTVGGSHCVPQYQWYSGNPLIAIPGATSSEYTIPVEDLPGAGQRHQYRCRACAGPLARCTDSDIAIVANVVAPGLSSFTIDPVDVCDAYGTTLTVNATSGLLDLGISTVFDLQWRPNPETGWTTVLTNQRIGTPIPYLTSAQFAGQYRALVHYLQGSTAICPGVTTTSQVVDAVIIRSADYDGTQCVSLNDLFTFLDLWFVSDPQADFNYSGTVSVQDIFDYLTSYFTPCPVSCGGSLRVPIAESLAIRQPLRRTNEPEPPVSSTVTAPAYDPVRETIIRAIRDLISDLPQDLHRTELESMLKDPSVPLEDILQRLESMRTR